jgi:hypothetical protein
MDPLHRSPDDPEVVVRVSTWLADSWEENLDWVAVVYVPVNEMRNYPSLFLCFPVQVQLENISDRPNGMLVINQ